MRRTFFIIGLLLLLVSCNQPVEDCQTPDATQDTLEKQDEKPLTNPGCTTPEDPTQPQDPEGPTDPTDPNEDPIDEVPAEAKLFDINATLFKFETQDEIKVKKAFAIIKKVVASAEFRNRVINFTYQGKKTYVDNEGLSNEQIYQKLLDASEELIPGDDHQMDVELELYYSSKNTVGYTYANVSKIWMNTKYFDPYTPSEVAGNVFHEWTHKLGFGHSSSYSTARDSSVPYAIGYIMRDLGKKYE